MYFRNDYSETCHPAVLEALGELAGRHAGYGEDAVTLRAAETIRRLAECPEAGVYFLAGGTVTNMLAISSLLRPHEAVIAAESGHINVHESGAIEASGHKVLAIPTLDGRLRPADLLPVLEAHRDPAKVKPRMVYISDSTEVGTVYRLDELEALSSFCRAEGLLLFLDGARLGQALASPANDLTLPDIARLTDLFYIGGTKNGALFGEALVICRPALQADMPRLIKNRGAMLAKGFVPALMFERLLATTEGAPAEGYGETLYSVLAEKAWVAASDLAGMFTAKGYRLTWPAESNQVFVTLPADLRDRLIEHGVSLESETETSEGAVCRFVTTYSTDRAELEALGRLL